MNGTYREYLIDMIIHYGNEHTPHAYRNICENMNVCALEAYANGLRGYREYLESRK